MSEKALNKENKPVIRFGGFDENWTSRALREFTHRITRKNEENQSDLPLTISAQYGLIDQRNYFNNQVAARDMSNYYLLKRGEFAYNKSTSVDNPWGAVKYLSEYDEGCVSTLYICFGLDQGNREFLNSYYETDRWYTPVQMIAAEGARNHGLLNIAADDFLDTKLTIPTDVREQEKIGAVFEKLDRLIALHRRKVEKLTAAKKALLVKLFPSEGETVPALRFAGFTGKWEERRLGDVVLRFIVPMRDKPTEFGGDIPWTRIEDIEGKYLNDSLSGQYVTKEIIKKMNLKIIPKGSLIVSTSATFGVVAVVTNDLITNQTFIGLVPSDKKALDYWYSYFHSNEARQYMRLQSAGSTIFYIERMSFENMPVSVPPKAEQEKIGKTFEALDQLIALHRRKVEKLTDAKKALLNKMFCN